MAEFVTKEGDTGVPLVATLSDANGVIDLSAYTGVTFSMGLSGQANKVENADCDITDAAAGEVTYTWQAADVDTPGVYDGEFLATTGGGATIRFPRDRQERYLSIRILPHRY
jgi:hypothetical protein